MHARYRAPGEAEIKSRPMRLSCVVALSSGLLLAGCSSDLFNRDGEALDRFSHAYTEFRETDEITEGAIHYLGSDSDPYGFWAAFRGALATDPKSYDAGRLTTAESAIALYDSNLPRALDAAADQVAKLDKAVARSFETANAIHNQEFRENANRVAKYAREEAASVGLIQALIDRRTRLQRKHCPMLSPRMGVLSAL
jgi:hypothetical protein